MSMKGGASGTVLLTPRGGEVQQQVEIQEEKTAVGDKKRLRHTLNVEQTCSAILASKV